MPVELFGFSIGRTGRQQPLLEPAEERKAKQNRLLHRTMMMVL